MRLARLTSAMAVLIIALFSTAALFIHPARAQQNPPPAAKPPEPLYVVSFVDYAGGATVTEQGTKDIQQYVLDTRKDPGNIRCEGIAQVGRTNHLAVIEVWQNQEAFDRHEAAAHTKNFREAIQPKLGAPFDQRLHFVVQ
jgi:quinol monooxygenase YgiN